MQDLFPYDEARPVQKGFMKQVEAAILNKTALIAHCPTGVGKTAAALSPALAAAIGNKLTVFFLTSRHTQHMIAVETLLKIKQKHNLNFAVVDIIGKRHMCCQKGISMLTSSEFGDFCTDLREKGECQYFNNLKTSGKVSFDALRAIQELKKEPCHVEKLKQIASDYSLCPFEVACLLGKEAHVVIADYYHFLHPHIRKNLLTRMGKNIADCIVIMDEGHNLPARSRKLLTQTIVTFTIERAAKEARITGSNDVAAQLTALAAAIENLQSSLPQGKSERMITKQEIVSIVEGITNYEVLCESLHSIAEEIIETKKKSYAASVANFLEAWKGPDQSFIRILSKQFGKSKPYLSIAYKCLDPSIALKEVVEGSHSLIVMSGTLTPTDMYKDLLGFKENTFCAEYANPFPKENRLNLVVPKTSTKYTVRSDKMYGQIAKECADIANAIPGNSVIFFPSYYLRDNIYPLFRDKCNKTVFTEEQDMTKDGKAELLDSFKSYKDVGAVLLGVSSGSFGEGIDLVGDYLKSVVVVGLPLNKPDLETEELIKYYDAKFGKGWDYGYVMPAIITTMQNAGRCIRSETDRGVIVFLDERYLWQRYYTCFPKDWSMKIATNAVREIEKFYSTNKA